MPTYDYACGRCGRRVEVVHGVHAHGPTACESCGGPMRKLLSSPAIHFRGSGWAKKDAREATRRTVSRGEKKTETASGGAEGGPASGAEGRPASGAEGGPASGEGAGGDRPASAGAAEN